VLVGDSEFVLDSDISCQCFQEKSEVLKAMIALWRVCQQTWFECWRVS